MLLPLFCCARGLYPSPSTSVETVPTGIRSVFLQIKNKDVPFELML